MAENVTQIHITATPPEGSFDDSVLSNVGVDTPNIESKVNPTPTIQARDDKEQVDVIISGLGEENVPDPRLFKFLSDKYGVSERLLKQTYKVLQDGRQMADLDSKLVQKVLTDSAVNSESITKVWNIIRQYADNTTHSEVLAKLLQKVSSDLASAGEQSSKLVSKPLSDTTMLQDLSYATILVSSGKFETVYSTDEFSRVVSYNREFVDYILTTDDFYGLANIDDDEYALVYKVIVEWIAVSDQASIDVVKAPFEDTGVTSEQAYLAPALSKSDQSTATASTPVLSVDKPTTDSILTSETVKQAVGKKAELDNTAVGDEPAIRVNRPVEPELVVTQDSDYVFSITKGLRDLLALQELVQIAFATKFIDASTATDSTYIDVSTVASDSAGIVEAPLHKLIGLVLEEADYFLQAYALEDYSQRAVHLVDSITSFVVRKEFNELVDATDDFYGVANIDDDQYSSINKPLLEYLATSDLFSRVVEYKRIFTELVTTSEVFSSVITKTVLELQHLSEQVSKDFSTSRSDTAQISDVAAQLVAKALSDNNYTSDSNYFATTKLLLDSSTTSEVLSKVAATVYSDVATCVESITHTWTALRDFAETTTTTDRYVFAVQKSIIEAQVLSEVVNVLLQKQASDTTSTSEAKYFEYYKLLTELVDATDDFYGVANIDDDQIAAVAKILSDSVAIAETFTTLTVFNRSFSEQKNLSDIFFNTLFKPISDSTNSSDTVQKLEAKVLLETVSTSQSLSLNNQSYFAGKYVQVGYVGENFSY